MKRNEQLLHAIGDVGLDLVELSELHEPFGGKWRRMGALAACLVLAAGITAAAFRLTPVPSQSRLPQEATPELSANSHVSSEAEAADSYESFLPEESDNPVIPLYDLSVDYSDIVDNNYFCLYYVPQLNYSSPDALAINAEIAEIFGGQVEEQMRSIDEKNSLFFTRIGAEEYWHGSIVTLLCHMGTEGDIQQYAVYHFDTGTQTRLSNAELLERLEYNAEQHLQALRQAAHRCFLRDTMLYGNYDPETADKALTDQRWKQYRQTMEQDMTLDMPMYVDEDGIVHAIVTIYSVAGANWYQRDLTSSDTIPAWDCSTEEALDYRTQLTQLWDHGDPHMTLYLADPSDLSAVGAYETVTLPRDWYLERFCVLMDSFVWTEQADPCPAPGNMWINLSGSGSFNWTFWEDGDAGFLVVQDPTQGVRFWKADYLYDTDRQTGATIAQCIRHEYDGTVIDYTALSVDGASPTEVCENFCRAFGELLLSQAPGSVYGAKDFALISCQVMATGDPKADGTGSAILAACQIALIPELDGYRSWLWAGNSVEGEGEYEGWMILSREILMAPQADGTWCCLDMGTGGLGLPE